MAVGAIRSVEGVWIARKSVVAMRNKLGAPIVIIGNVSAGRFVRMEW
ncbi:hypothetical protein [Helicobacter mesocricetorum]|nr:hypothetical protein [Helicobacter mesocricetorum]